METVYKSLYKRSDKFDEYISKSQMCEFNWTEGSIRSGKSVSNIAAFCYNLLLSPEPLHLAIATTASTAKTILFDSNGLGIKHFFQGLARETKYQGHDALVIKIGKSKKIILAIGGQDSGSYKTFRGMSIGSVIMTEIDLLHEETIVEALNRTTASKHRRIFIDNNPTNPNHAIYSDSAMYSLERLQRIVPDKINFMHATIYDNPSMSKEQIDDILKAWDPNSVQYKRFILGQRVVAENLIYNIYDYNILDEVNPNDYMEYILVADPGVNSSATAFILMGITKGYTSVDVLKEYYHRNADVNKLAIKLTSDYADDFVQFLTEAIQYMGGRYPRMIFTDLDVSFQRELRIAMNKAGYSQINFKDAIKNDIDERIRQGVSMLYTKKLRFARECVRTIESFRAAQYNPTDAVKGKYTRWDKPELGGITLDAVDATEYGFTFYLPYIYRR
jgi:PBSX family phage terminase large subunit